MVVIVAFSTFVCLGQYNKTFFFFFHFLDFFLIYFFFNIHFVLIGWKLLIEFALSLSVQNSSISCFYEITHCFTGCMGHRVWHLKFCTVKKKKSYKAKSCEYETVCYTQELVYSQNEVTMAPWHHFPHSWF